MLDGVLLDGGTKVLGGCDESSDVRITAKINATIRTTAAKPAAAINPGRLDQCTGSWS